MTGTADPEAQAEWLRARYNIFIVPDELDRKVRLMEDTLKAAQIKEPLNDGFRMAFDN